MYDLNTLKKLSAPYSSLVAFKQANSEAYRSASSQGLLRELYPSPTRELNLSEAEVRERAARYSTKSQFKQGAKHHFKRAEELRILEDMFGSRIKWTLEKLKATASKCKTLMEFKEHENNAYYAAQRWGVLDEVCENLERERTRWTEDLIRDSALKCKTRAEFRENYNGAYIAASKNNLINDVCSHMKPSKYQKDNNVIYIWQALDDRYNGKPVYKVGISSKRLGFSRINSGARSAGIKRFEIIVFQETKNAYPIEKEVLKLGENPKFLGFEGYTEFRAFSEHELNTALELIKRLK